MRVLKLKRVLKRPSDYSMAKEARFQGAVV